jgi:hypothetical protein
MIFEEDIEKSDFFEVILTPEEYEKLMAKGIINDFPKGLYNKRNLNVYLWVDKNHEDDMPLVKGKKASSREGFSENVKKEMEAGKPQKQAVAIAYSEARGGKKKPAKKGKR